MNRTHHNDLTSPQLTHLALIWPYDPRGGVIAGILPLDAAARRSAVAGGYQVVAAVRQQAPYTHVVTAGGQDYLATLVAGVAAPPPLGTNRGLSAAGQSRRGAATTPKTGDAGSLLSPIAPAGQDADRQEQAWESEGGALAGWSDAGVAVDPSPGPSPVRQVDAGVFLVVPLD
jgi:hypothetical protein